MKLKYFIILFIFTLILNSCDKQIKSARDERVLARVRDELLYISDISDKIPKNISTSDSIIVAQTFINNWVKNKMLINLAEENLSEDELDFEEKLKNYKESLILYKYETKYLRKALDTTVNPALIEDYYQKNLKLFPLKEEAIKINYLILPNEYKNNKKAKKMFVKTDTLWKIEQFSKDENIEYYLEDYWFKRSDFQYFEPLDTLYNAHYEVKSILDYYKNNQHFLVKITDYKAIGEPEPLNFVEGKIKKIIINQRKRNLLKAMQQKALRDGYNKNIIEIY